MPRRHKIAVVVGHTKGSPGAVAAAPLSVSEFAYNSLLAELISSHVTAAGHECHIVIRQDGTDRDGAAALVNNWQADA